MRTKILGILVCFSLISGCATHKAPSSLSGPGVAAWQANEVVIALDAVMSTAIALNEIVQCDNNNQNCHQVLSEQNTRIIVQAIRGADMVIKSYPTGWSFVADTAISQIETYLDSSGRAKIAPYLEAAKVVIRTLRNN
jgi:uncharacterized lipoprotein YajG